MPSIEKSFYPNKALQDSFEKAYARYAAAYSSPEGTLIMTDFFGSLSKIKYEGPDSDNPLAFHHYNSDEIVMGKSLKDHLRFAVAYWHSFAWEGGDPFGGRIFDRPWFGDEMAKAKLKADVAFELFDLLGAPFFCFHDADVRPEGKNFAETLSNLNEIVDYFEEKMASSETKLLWGTANMFSKPPLHVRRFHQP